MKMILLEFTLTAVAYIFKRNNCLPSAKNLCIGFCYLKPSNTSDEFACEEEVTKWVEALQPAEQTHEQPNYKVVELPPPISFLVTFLQSFF